ncbi:hypothetical protein [Plasmodium yoelii yoelii]|uniref:Uncharacterized protein n=1 Tax=Plasmodium yoelii yoelii TaxID=73239 RepID=Q7RLY9_PLAYO|nr:hypothetical protein [Plasmodium yoelii yoelii]
MRERKKKKIIPFEYIVVFFFLSSIGSHIIYYLEKVNYKFFYLTIDAHQITQCFVHIPDESHVVKIVHTKLKRKKLFEANFILMHLFFN